MDSKTPLNELFKGLAEGRGADGLNEFLKLPEVLSGNPFIEGLPNVPPMEICGFCGAERQTRGRRAKDFIAWNRLGAEECPCAKAAAEREEREEREKIEIASRDEELLKARAERDAKRAAEEAEREAIENPFAAFVSVGGLVSSGDARIPAGRKPPPESCEFCGRELYTRGIPMGNKIIWNPLGTEDCDCPKGRELAERDRAERQAAAEEKRRLEEERDRERERSRLLGQSGMGERFRQRTFETFKTPTAELTKIRGTAEEYAKDFERKLPKKGGEIGRNGLFISGGIGAGKTHIAAAIANFLLEKGTGVICMTERELFWRIRQTYSAADGDSEGAVLDAYKRVPLLIIDDLGKEKPSDWTIATLYSIIDGRYENGKPVIITTNYTPAALIGRLTPAGRSDETTAEATIDRLREMCEAITMSGGSMRGKID
jgi:DNA replication protein DnaC